jgi:hypothetical protein
MAAAAVTKNRVMSTTKAAQPPRTGRTAAALAGLFLFDLGYAGQGFFSVLPDRLEQLVPEFLPAVPRAKYTFAWGEFTYSTSAKDHTLMYVVIPPFGRLFYHFEEARWTQLD